jgi:Undecaprenyl-phosphate galactose phosphotransferase WbaP
MSSVSSDEFEFDLTGASPTAPIKPNLDRALRRLGTSGSSTQIERFELFGLKPRLFSTASWRCLCTILPLFVVDLLTIALCGALAHLVVRVSFPAVAGSMARIEPAALAVLAIIYWLGGTYFGSGIHPVVELRHLVYLTTFWFLAGAVGARCDRVYILWSGSTWLAAVSVIPSGRAVVRYLCGHRSWWGYPALIIGSAQTAPAVAHLLMRDPESGLRPIAITDPTARCQTELLPVFNEPESLETFVRANAIQHAIISLPELPNARLADVLDRYGKLVPHLLVLSNSSVLPGLWGVSRSYGRWTAVEVQNRSIRATLLLVKRTIDLLAAVALLLLSLPVIIGVAILVKLTSPGPVIYGHKRIGAQGEPFNTWKFRTMYSDSENVLREYLKRDPAARAEWDRDYKLRYDPRVTPIGAFLRKWSLDELPQLWNVLKGEMSMVGPRPIVTDEISKYGDVFKLYKAVKPGLTGLWQVSGRNDVTYEDRVWLDQYYIRNWSPWMDLYIVPQTVVAMLRRTGAY